MKLYLHILLLLFGLLFSPQLKGQDEAEILSNYASGLYNIGRYEEAIDILSEAAAIYKDRGNQKNLSIVYNNIGSAYSKLNNYRKALEYYSLSGETPEALNNMAVLYQDLGEKSKALECFQKAIDISQDKIIPMVNLASFFYLDGRFDKAIEVTDEALFECRNPKDSLLVFQSKSTLYAKSKKKALCIHYLSICEKIAESSYNKETVEMADYLSAKGLIYELIGDFGESGRNYLKSYNLFRSIFSGENSQLLPLEYCIANVYLGEGNYHSAIEYYTDYFSKKAVFVKSCFQNLASDEKKGFWDNNSSGMYDAPRFCYESKAEGQFVGVTYNTVLFSKGLLFNSSGENAEDLSLTWEDVKNKLSRSEIAIEFVSYKLKSGKEGYGALLLRSDWNYPKMVHLFSEDSLSVNDDYSFWNPLLPYFQKGDTVYFSPSGKLNSIPIEYFNSEYHFRRLSSTRQICKSSSGKMYDKVILYGGIDYVEKEVERGGIPSFPTLKYSYEEISSIHKICKRRGISSVVYSSVNATEKSFRGLSVLDSDNAIIHIASHGFYYTPLQASLYPFFKYVPLNTENTSMFRSGIIFAGGNTSWENPSAEDSVEDGIMTSYEISKLKLQKVSLVVLSACQTALGDISPEGVYGLQRAFKMAGVSTIVSSLWEVNDKATRLLMEEFYRCLLSGDEIHSALKKGQDYLRTFREYEDMHYWGAFIIID